MFQFRGFFPTLIYLELSDPGDEGFLQLLRFFFSRGHNPCAFRVSHDLVRTLSSSGMDFFSASIHSPIKLQEGNSSRVFRVHPQCRSYHTDFERLLLLELSDPGDVGHDFPQVRSRGHIP